MALTDVFKLLGGLGLFLYGMTIMSDSLRLVAGDNMRNVLEKTTKNRFLGVIMGMVVTFLIQSSSATTVMTVSFVSAGARRYNGCKYRYYDNRTDNCF